MHILKKSAHSLIDAWSFLLIHIRFTPSKRPKDFVNWFFKKSDHESWTMEIGPWKNIIFHGPISWSMVYTALSVECQCKFSVG